MRSSDEMAKIREIMTHVTKLFDFYSESDSFFDEFMDFVLKGDISEVLDCFRDLRRHIELFHWEKKKDANQMQGMRYRPPFVSEMQK